MAEDLGIISTSATSVTFGADSTHVYNLSDFIPYSGIGGRQSIRLQSYASWTHGLYVLDLNHMPFGCGTWPAFWSVGFGATWPIDGEIDIIEGWNLNTMDLMTLHTNHSCTTAGFYETGTLIDNQCYQNLDFSQNGCSVSNPDTTSYGAGLNAVGGGVYAMEWTSQFIRIWWFPRTYIPECITAGKPDPDTFGPAIKTYEIPAADFMAYPNGSCTIDQNFYNHTIVFDLAFCGANSGAGSTNYATSTCPQVVNMSGTDSCNYFVANNPEAFANAYWTVNSLKVYQQEAQPQYVGPWPTAQWPMSMPPGWNNWPLGSPETTWQTGPVSIPTLTEIPPGSSKPTYAGPNTWTGAQSYQTKI